MKTAREIVSELASNGWVMQDQFVVQKIEAALLSYGQSEYLRGFEEAKEMAAKQIPEWQHNKNHDSECTGCFNLVKIRAIEPKSTNKGEIK